MLTWPPRRQSSWSSWGSRGPPAGPQSPAPPSGPPCPWRAPAPAPACSPSGNRPRKSANTPDGGWTRSQTAGPCRRATAAARRPRISRNIFFPQNFYRYLAKFRLVENRNKRNITCGMLIHKTNFLWFHTTLRIGTVCEIQEYFLRFFHWNKMKPFISSFSYFSSQTLFKLVGWFYQTKPFFKTFLKI